MSSGWDPHLTADGSHTFFSEEFQESFHSQTGARTEAETKYVRWCRLTERAQSSQIHLLDVCYGLGYNTAAALETIWRVNPDCQVQWYGLEMDASVPLAAVESNLLGAWSGRVQGVLGAIAQGVEAAPIAPHQSCEIPGFSGCLLLGDARHTIQTVLENAFLADAIFFDPFSPKHCPQLWSVEFLGRVAHSLAPQGTLVTYSRSAAVRAALQQVGLQIGSIPPQPNHAPHDWSLGTVAQWEFSNLPALPLAEQQHLQTRAAVPFRDPNLRDPADVLKQRRQAEQQVSQLRSTSSWRRQWGIPTH
jgi:tRNA U34 5-methylaminomethyl-2-thiouridine-forming methyltransferase MnmC